MIHKCFCSILGMKTPTMILSFNLLTLHHHVPVQESEVSLRRAVREADAHPDARRRKLKKDKKPRRKNLKSKRSKGRKNTKSKKPGSKNLKIKGRKGRKNLKNKESKRRKNPKTKANNR